MRFLITRLADCLRVMCFVGALLPFNAFADKYCTEVLAFPGDYGEMSFDLVTNDTSGSATMRVVAGMA